jgi:SAM-dependent methyltransferase
MGSDPAARNRAWWDAQADDYQAKHGEFIGGMGWGMWHLPEAELRVLGDTAGLDVLELGCGAAQWSIELASEGARVVGLDNSERQLEFARRAVEARGVDVRLVHSPAGSVPLPDRSFDVVFSDHGATTFVDPYLWVPEAARLLRPGGLLAFCHIAPLDWVCYDEATEATVPRLMRPYFGLHVSEDPDGPVAYNLEIGAWIRLFRRHGFAVEDLIEIQPPAGAQTTYRTAEETEWARQWPMEEIWKALRV